MSVRLLQAVFPSEAGIGWSAGVELWEMDCATDHAPRDGDTVQLTMEGLANEVKRAYLWAGTGMWEAELTPFQLDPADTTLCDGSYRRSWWTERDGDLNVTLEGAGWRRYVPDGSDEG